MRDLDTRQQQSRLHKNGYLAAGLLTIALVGLGAYLMLIPSLLPVQ